MITRSMFQEALDKLLPSDELDPDVQPPVVFVSMHDSCETIMTNIKEARVLVTLVTS